MKKYRELKKAGALRKKTPLDNETRWSGKKEMLQRFDELQEFIDTNDPDIVMIYPSVGKLYQLKNLLDTLKTLESITINLQGEDIDLGDLRLLFDGVIKKFSEMARYLPPMPTLCIRKSLRQLLPSYAYPQKQF